MMMMFFGSHLIALLSRNPGLPLRESKALRLATQAVIEKLENRTLFTAMYWDPSGAAVANGGSGTWNTANADWRQGSPTGPLVAWRNSANEDAVFPASAGIVSLGSAITAKSLTFTTNGYVIAGNTLTLAGGNGRVDVVAG